MERTTRVLVSIMPVKTPIHGTYKGHAIKACIPNTAGLKGAPSFRKPYLVAESAYVSERDGERFMARLTEQGFYI